MTASNDPAETIKQLQNRLKLSETKLENVVRKSAKVEADYKGFCVSVAQGCERAIEAINEGQPTIANSVLKVIIATVGTDETSH